MAESDLTGADGTDTIMDPPHLPPVAAPDATPTVVGAPQHFCPNCHSPVSAEAAFCPSCGEALAANPFVSTPITANQSSGVAPSPISMTRPATPSVSASASRATQAGVKRPAAKSGVSAGDVIELIVDLIGGAWSLIVSAAVVIVVVVAGIAFIKSHFGSGLNGHSTCEQFQQADTSAQDKALQDMMNTHNDHGSIYTARLSVDLYCRIYGGSAHIDGVYSNGHVGAGPERASRDAAPALVYVVYSS